jgi:hypothetical protein
MVMKIILTFKLIYQIGLCSLLQCLQSTRLEPQFFIYLMCNFTHQPLEGQFREKEVGRLLVTLDFSKSNSWEAVSNI